QRVGPGRAATFGVVRPGRGRQVAAVDGRAAGRIGHNAAVAKQLRHELDVRRLTAARAGARELKQRLLNLLLADAADVDQAAIQLWDIDEEVPVLALQLADWRLGLHVDGLEAGGRLVLCRADINADAAGGAVFR